MRDNDRPAATHPRVSVGLPVFNGERFLERAIASALDQSYEDFELIIGDNASTDGTEEICRRFARDDPRVRYHRHAENIGLAGNFNFVFEVARGELFRWIAHDDVSEPRLLERCVAAMDAAGPRAALAFPKTRIIDEKDALVDDWEHGGPWDGSSAHTRLASLFRNRRGYLHLCSPVFGVIRSDLLRTTRLLRPFGSADKVLLVELALLGDFVEVEERLFMRRFHPGTSLRANPTPEALATLFDPAHRGRAKPRTRIFGGYLDAIRRAPLSPAERVRCLAVLAGALMRGRNLRVIGGEVTAPLRARVGTRLGRSL